MPTYHYKCTACLHEFEEFQSMADDPLVKCPECRKKKLVRVISGAGLVFKGSGFYLTDYKQRGTPPEVGGSTKTPSAAGGTGAEGEKSGKKNSGGKESSAPDGGGKKEKKSKPASGEGPSGGKA
jgi:putative FmdB family regulatory protein